MSTKPQSLLYFDPLGQSMVILTYPVQVGLSQLHFSGHNNIIRTCHFDEIHPT